MHGGQFDHSKRGVCFGQDRGRMVAEKGHRYRLSQSHWRNTVEAGEEFQQLFQRRLSIIMTYDIIIA